MDITFNWVKLPCEPIIIAEIKNYKEIDEDNKDCIDQQFQAYKLGYANFFPIDLFPST